MLSGRKLLCHLSESQFTCLPCCVLIMWNCRFKPSNPLPCSRVAEVQIQMIKLMFMLSGSKPLYQLSCSQFTHGSYDAKVLIQTIELVFMLSGIKLLYQLSHSQLKHVSYDAEMQIQTIELVFMLSGSILLYLLSHSQFKHVPYGVLKPSNLCSCNLEVNHSTTLATHNLYVYLAAFS